MARIEVCAPAVVLRTVDYGDRDRIVTLLVAGYGRRGAMAKGARASRRRFAGALEPLRVIEASYIDRNTGQLATLTSASAIEVFPRIEASFEKTSLASYATELVRELSRDGVADDDLLNLLVSHYRSLDRTADVDEQLHQRFVLAAVEGAGFMPALGVCARCHREVTDEVAWRFLAEAGAICAACRRPGVAGDDISPGTLLHLAATAAGGGESPRAQRLARPVLLGIVRGVIGKDLKSTRFLEMVLR